MNTERINRIIKVLEAAKVPGAKAQESENHPTSWWTIGLEHIVGALHVGKKVRVLHRVGGCKRHITSKDWDGQAAVWMRPKYSSVNFPVGPIGDGVFSIQTSTKPQQFYWTNTGELEKYEYSFTRKVNDWHPFVAESESEWQVVATTEGA